MYSKWYTEDLIMELFDLWELKDTRETVTWNAASC